MLLARPASSLLILCMTTLFPLFFPAHLLKKIEPLLGPLLIDFGVFSRCVLSQTHNIIYQGILEFFFFQDWDHQ